MFGIRRWAVVAALCVAAMLALLLAGQAQARPATADKDGRPNILVVMTDDEAQADVAKMPNVKRLLEKQGTTFADAVDSFPLCCPARATFITGQYAHNHGVFGNFWPYGWYGMKHRANTLPHWLQRSGYRTALIGKWLNGYGAKDAHGEVPVGFDIWRGLLDTSAYDYFNFVMNKDGHLKAWGDKKFARGLVKFAHVEVTPNPTGLAGVVAALTKQFGPPPYHYWGTHKRKNYSPDVTGRTTEQIVRSQRHAKKPFFVWWAPAAPHREDVATTLMGRPGRDPRPAPRYAKMSRRYKLPRPPNFNQADFSKMPQNMVQHAPPLTAENIHQLQLDYEGRIGALRAVDDHVKKLIGVLRKTHQMRNTVIVFVSDNGWLQGQHRIPGDKFLPYEESLRVPLIIRGPGVPKDQTVHGQVSNVDFASTMLDLAHAKAGRVQDGVSLMPTVRHPRKRPNWAIEIEAPAPLFEQSVPQNAWDRPYKGVRTDRYTYVVYNESGDEELYDRKKDKWELNNVADDPAYAKVKARLKRELVKLNRCAGKSCHVKP